MDLPPEVARLANAAVGQSGVLIGRIADAATQMGVSQASAPLEELARGVGGMATIFGGQVGGPVTDSMQSLADEVAAWLGSGAVVASANRPVPTSSAYNPYGNSLLSQVPGVGPVFSNNSGVTLPDSRGRYSANPYSANMPTTPLNGNPSPSDWNSPSAQGTWQQNLPSNNNNF